MIANSSSPDSANNQKLKRQQAKKNETNRQWLSRILKLGNFDSSGLLLIGGNSVADFRIRVAQSHLRHDLTPSYWSIVGILIDGDKFYSVPLDWGNDLSEVPHRNAIELCSMKDFDDPIHYPNIALIRFATNVKPIADYSERLKMQRNIVDLPALVIAWLEFVWAVGDKGNPLVDGKGLPSAVFAETVYGIAGIELTPGLATPSSCPEAIWQAAKWWSAFYSEMSRIESGAPTKPQIPVGYFALRQPAAAIYEKPWQPSTKS